MISEHRLRTETHFFWQPAYADCEEISDECNNVCFGLGCIADTTFNACWYFGPDAWQHGGGPDLSSLLSFVQETLDNIFYYSFLLLLYRSQSGEDSGADGGCSPELSLSCSFKYPVCLPLSLSLFLSLFLSLPPPLCKRELLPLLIDRWPGQEGLYSGGVGLYAACNANTTVNCWGPFVKIKIIRKAHFSPFGLPHTPTTPFCVFIHLFLIQYLSHAIIVWIMTIIVSLCVCNDHWRCDIRTVAAWSD